MSVVHMRLRRKEQIAAELICDLMRFVRLEVKKLRSGNEECAVPPATTVLQLHQLRQR